MTKEPCISVGFTGTSGDGSHIKPSAFYQFTWLPKGYGVDLDQRTVCTLFDPAGLLESRLRKGERHPLIEKIATVIEEHFRQNPAEVVGFFDHPTSRKG